MTDRTLAKDQFPYALFCDPYDPDALREAIWQAYSSEKTIKPRPRTWTEFGRYHLALYERVLQDTPYQCRDSYYF